MNVHRGEIFKITARFTGGSSVWNLLHVTLVASRIWRWLLNNWKNLWTAVCVVETHMEVLISIFIYCISEMIADTRFTIKKSCSLINYVCIYYLCSLCTHLQIY
jgi:hypothetical protein